MADVSKSAAEWRRSIQAGIATPNECKAVVHVVRRFIEKQNDGSKSGLLSLDLINSFNVVSHTAFLKGVEERFPAFLAWVYYKYGGEPAYLWTGETFLRSVTGVEQGDLLGTLLFAIALQLVTLELRQRLQTISSCEGNDTRDVSNGWYFDDGYIIANHQQLSSAPDYWMSDEVDNYGLQLNLAKCEVW